MAEVTALRNCALPYPVYGAPWVEIIPIFDADGDLVTGAAGLDSERSLNGDTMTDCTNEAVEIGTTGLYYLSLSAAEMTADIVAGQTKTSTSGAKTTPWVLRPRKLAVIRAGTAAGGAAGSITLDVNASPLDGAYTGMLIVGTLDGSVEARICTGYTGSTQVATVSPAWVTTPDNNDTFVVYLIDAEYGALRPSVAGRLLDVSATGGAGVDWSNVEFQNSTVALSGTTIKSATDLEALIAGIGSAGGAAINTDAATSNQGGGISGVTSGTTIVGTPTNTYTATSIDNGVYHIITGTATAFDIVYQFLIGGGASPVNMVWTGYINSGNDSGTFQAWNHVGGAWETIGTVAGQAGTNDVTANMVLYARHVGTSVAERGKVYIRIQTSAQTNPVLNTDQIYVSYAITSRTVGYAEGAVWLDTTLSNTSTESFVDGTADNPVSTLAAARTIMTALGLKRLRIAAGSSITLASNSDRLELLGEDWILALGGQSVNGTHIKGATVTGICTGHPSFHECFIGDSDFAGSFDAFFCYLTATTGIQLGNADYYLIHCGDAVAGSGSAIFYFSGTTKLHLQNYSGGAEFHEMAGTGIVEWGGRGQCDIDADCSGGTVYLRGPITLQDDSGGAVTIVDSSRWGEDQHIAVADEIGALGAGAITDTTFSEDGGNALADFVLKRKIASALATAIGEGGASADVESLAGLVMAHLYWDLSGTDWNIYKPSAALWATRTAAPAPAGDPISGVEP